MLVLVSIIVFDTNEHSMHNHPASISIYLVIAQPLIHQDGFYGSNCIHPHKDMYIERPSEDDETDGYTYLDSPYLLYSYPYRDGHRCLFHPSIRRQKIWINIKYNHEILHKSKMSIIFFSHYNMKLIILPITYQCIHSLFKFF